MLRKENYIYVGVICKKPTQRLSLIVGTKLDEITFENKPEFNKLTKKVAKHNKNTSSLWTGNAYGYGRSLAIWLIEHGCM